MSESVCGKCGREIPTHAFDGRCPYCLLSEAAGLVDTSEEMTISRDTNLLFALLANLLNFISPSQFASALSYWTANPGIRMSSLLVERKLISAANRDYVEGLIEQSLEFHDGDPKAAINALGGYDRIERVLRQSVDTSQRTLLTTKLGLKGRDAIDDSDTPLLEAVDEKLGRYTRTREFSRGGMGRILLVHDELLLRDIALKELLPKSSANDETLGEDSPMRQSGAMMARFLREARITGSLEHPTIVPVYELGRRENGSLYYTMKLVRGKTLRMALDECHTLSDRLRLLPNFLDLCLGVGYAHSKGIVHRDLKPSNVMIGEFGETVIIDWGLAKIVGARDDDDFHTLKQYHGPDAINPDKTAEGERMGSPNYMSPEQASGEVDAIDTRSDVFSLGVMLYELMTGSVPFVGSSVEAIMHRVQECEVPPIADMERHAPLELISVCMRALSKKPRSRYASAKEMGDDIRNFLSGSLVSVYRYSLKERMARYYSRNRAIVNLSLSSAVILLIVITGSFIWIRDSRDEAIVARNEEKIARETAQHTQYISQIRLTANYLEQNNLEAAENLLWNIDPKLRGWEWGHLLNLTTPDILRIKGFYRIALSPDGTRLAAISAIQPVTIFDTHTGERLLELDVIPKSIRSVEFSSDGNRLLMSSLDRKVLLWDLRANALIHEFPTGFNTPNDAHFFPNDTRLFAVSRNRLIGEIRIWDETTREQIAILQCGDGITDAYVAPDGSTLIAYRGDSTSTPPEIQAWNLETYEKIWTAPGRRPIIESDNSILCARDNDIVCLSISDGKEQYTLSAHRSEVTQIAVNPESRIAVTGDMYGSVTVWNLNGRSLVGGALLEGRQIRRITMIDSGSRALVSDNDGNVALLDLPSGQVARTFAGHTQYARYLLADSKHDFAFTSSNDNSIRIWPLKSPPLGVNTFALPGLPMRLARASNSNTIVVSQFANGALLFDSETDSIELGYRVRPTTLSGESTLTNDGRYTLLNLDGHSCIIYDRESRSVILTVGEHNGRLSALAATRNLGRIVTAGWDGDIHVYDKTGRRIQDIKTGSSITALSTAPDESILVAGLSSGSFIAVDLTSISEPTEISAHNQEITDVTFDRTSKLFCLASQDKTVSIWDSESLSESMRIGPSLNPVRSCSFDSTSDRLAVVTHKDYDAPDKTDIWDVRSGTLLFTMQGNRADVIDAIFHNDKLIELAEGVGIRTYTQVDIDASMPLVEQNSAFDAYRFTQFEKNSDPNQSTSTAETTIVFATPSNIARTLAELSRSLEPRLTAETQAGVAIVENDELSIGLAVGNAESLVRINGQVMASINQVALTFETLSQEIAAGTRETFDIEFVQDSSYARNRYVLIPMRSDEPSLSLTRQEIVERLTVFADAIEDNADNLDEYNDRRNEGIAVALDRDGQTGFFITGSAFQFQYADYVTLGIGDGDQILEINGQATNDAASIVEALRQAALAIESNESDQLKLRIWRGEFRESTLTLSAVQ